MTWVLAIFAMGLPISNAQDTLFYADFENTSGDNNWTLATNASDGNWVIGTPTPYTTVGVQMEIAALSGSGTLQTGLNNNQDLDGGPVTAQSPDINIPSGTTTLSLGQYFSHYQNSSSADFYTIEIRSTGSNTLLDTVLAIVGTSTDRDAMWTTLTYDLSSYEGQSIYIQLDAADIGTPSKVEAALDLVLITNIVVEPTDLSCEELLFDDFESGVGSWVDGGSDAQLFNNSTYTSSGSFSFRLRDNTNTSVISTAINYDLTNVDTVKVSFHAYPLSLENTEDLWFQISDDGGASYTTLQTWANGAELSNGIPATFEFSIGGAFTATTRFRFRLDASGNGDYVFIDDILIESCTNTSILTSDNIYTGCEGDGYNSIVGLSTYSEINPSGVDTLLSSQGIDSIVTTELTFNPVSQFDNLYTGCEGDGFSISIDGNIYNEANPTGADTLLNAYGCDSIIQTALTFNSIATFSNTYAGCEGDGYTSIVGLSTYDESNTTGIDTLMTSNGCDSIVFTTLVFNSTFSFSNSYSGCVGDGYTATIGLSTYDESNQTGVDTLTAISGCDSIIFTTLVFNSEVTFTNFYSGCESDGYTITIGSSLYNEGNPTGTDTLTSSSGCDSIIFTTLLFNTDTVFTNSYIGCEGDGYSLTVGGNVYNEISPSGIDTLTSSYGCDSIVTTELVFNPATSSNVDYTGISGDGYMITINGNVYDENNPMGSESLINSLGCDSVISINLVFSPPLCPVLSLQDSFVCNLQSINIDGSPMGGSGSFENHSWQDIGTGSAMGYVLSDIDQQILTIDLSTSTSGSINIAYSVEDSTGCLASDTMQFVVISAPLCEIVADNDTICNGISASLRTVNQYSVTPFEGMVISAGSGPGLTQDHTIIGVQDPAHTKIVITLPTWDDHFDATLLNGELILPEIFETDSYNAGGMNCNTPWVANSNGLPRSIIEIKSGSVRYFSSLTTTATVMTEVFPTNWTTTPRNIIEGDNVLRFGVQNTAGPVSGSWFVEAIGNEGYTYLWNTGATADSITISPTTSETYSVTVTSPNGCTSTCSYNIVVQDIEIETFDVFLCPESEIDIASNITLANEPLTHLWGPTDTLIAGIMINGTGNDSLNIIADNTASGIMNLYHFVQDAKGCQVIDTFQVTVVPEIRDSLFTELCPGLDYQFGDSTITESGYYEKTDMSQLGCDSVTVVEVVFLPTIRDTLQYIGCEGDGYSLIVNGTTYDETQPTGFETLSTSEGCDSIVHIDFFYQDSIITNINYSGCSDDGYSILVNGTLYDFANPNGIESTTATSGCDSTIIVNLTYNLAAVVEAGMPSNTLCSNSELILSELGASISGGTSSGTWTTTGDGYFDNSGDFETATTYTPGPLDIAFGEIILNLTSDNPPGSCEPEADAAMILINDISCSQFPWAGN